MVYNAYNLTGMGNSSGIVQLVQSVNNNLMFHHFGNLILVTISVMAFMAFLVATGNNVGKSLSATSFIAFGLSILMAILGLVPEITIYATLIIAGLTVAFAWEK